MDLPSELPCYNCGKIVSTAEREIEPFFIMPDLPPNFGSGEKYEKDMKKFIMRNWWCKDCYNKRTKEIAQRHGW